MVKKEEDKSMVKNTLVLPEVLELRRKLHTLWCEFNNLSCALSSPISDCN